MSEVPQRDWRPAASLAAQRDRARMLASIRAFFMSRECMEVSTPVLAPVAASDPQIECFALEYQGRSWWLQSSPEYHMKRLLAAGSGAIYQIAPAFRVDEQGRWHNPEFTMLEWYRPGIDHHGLMDEVEALWARLADAAEGTAPRYRYADLIQTHLGLDCQDASLERLRAAVSAHVGELPPDLDRDGLLDAAMGLLIGPELGADAPCFVFDFPPSQAALARINAQGWASRFEMYWRGIELANGFHELTDASEQRDRFEKDMRLRRERGLPEVGLDDAFLNALDAGLPDCAGVAMGIDRLLTLLRAGEAIADVIAFPAERA